MAERWEWEEAHVPFQTAVMDASTATTTTTTTTTNKNRRKPACLRYLKLSRAEVARVEMGSRASGTKEHLEREAGLM